MVPESLTFRTRSSTPGPPIPTPVSIKIGPEALVPMPDATVQELGCIKAVLVTLMLELWFPTLSAGSTKAVFEPSSLRLEACVGMVSR